MATVTLFLTGVCAVLVTGAVAVGVTRRRCAIALGIAMPTVVCLMAYNLTPTLDGWQCVLQTAIWQWSGD